MQNNRYEIDRMQKNDISLITRHGSAIRKNIQAVEAKMLDMPQVECNVFHRFGPGIYIREVTIPAGTFSIGHHQKKAHMNVLVKGRVTMLNEDGSTTMLTSPHVFVSQPGRKIGYIHEDMVWQNIYATEETNIDALEAEYIDKSAVWLENNKTKQAMQELMHEADREDYLSLLNEYEITEEIARSQSENKDDLTDTPIERVAVRKSPIEGKGLFATATILVGQTIGPARINGLRTIAGRYTNHAKQPNAEMVKNGNDIYLISTKDIAGCFGGQDGEEITIDYRAAINLARELA